MFKNYFRVAIRGFIRQKGVALLNIVGLAIGLASATLIFIYVQDELRYDTMHPAPDLTFGIGHDFTNDRGEKSSRPTVPAGWGSLLQDQMPEVVDVFRYVYVGFPYSMRNPDSDNMLLTHDGEVLLVEKTYPNVMYFPLLQGDKNQVFSQPNSIVLSETAAQRLFGTTDVLGRQLGMKHIALTDEYIPLEVTGVMKDYPSNSHLQPDYLLPTELLDDNLRKNLGISITDYLSSMDRFNAFTYVRLAEGADIANVEAALHRIVKEHLQDQASRYQPFLTNITDLHFDEKVDWSRWNASASFDYIILFSTIGLLILLIACINYMNLATAKSAKRSKEVGIRKTLGSSRLYLVGQFLLESVLTTSIALALALVLVAIVLPAFSTLADKDLPWTLLMNGRITGSLLLIGLVVAFVSGSYPALFLSSFKPTQVLKGTLTLGKGPAYFRKTLVIMQFSVSVLLIVSTGVILQQMKMLQSSKLYNQADQIISVRFGGGVAPLERYQALRDELLRDPQIIEVALAVNLPRRENFGGLLETSFVLPDISGDQEYNWKHLRGDYHFPDVFDMELVAGRSFDVQYVNDSTNYVINETAVRTLNMLPEEVIGLNLRNTTSDENGQVIGVVKDFPFESIYSNIKPMVIQGKPHIRNQVLYVKLPADEMSGKIADVERIWKATLPSAPFDYWFLSDEFGRMYRAELKLSNLVRLFSVLAVLIACLGLYGLASFTAEQKTKEIGIRKVLGASVPQIVWMLVVDFLKMILVACLIALPLGYFLMQNWLQNFAYRIDLSWSVFAISVAIIVGLTLLTVAYESIKASIVDPAKSLKNE
ncbi:ABC transporter permease [Ulvibacterium marinum]|uniref:ABC transporter permease n=1 Tax=Ulvibacterium marinum TaxID=2419782 RepID=A0A3B0C2T8_9FLAO|nr:ABC transporter permease [Ulvibacterium marinum]RKN79410.1 ABC transporter permease [Ulvibacterium marinum]